MNFATGRRVVRADGKQRQLDVKPVADFSEPREIGSVAAVKNRSTIRSNNESAEIAVRIREKPSTPMATRRERNFERAKLHGLPVIKLVYDMESEIVHQVSHAGRDNDGLVGSDVPERAPVEVVEMRMCHQDIINGRQMMNFEPRLF